MLCWRRLVEFWLSQHSSAKQRVKLLNHTPYKHIHAFRTCHTSVTLYTQNCMWLSLMTYRINGGHVRGLSDPTSPKWHHRTGLCPCLSGNLQQQSCERNIHCSGGWKDVITGRPKNNLFSSIFSIITCVCQYINTSHVLVSDCVWWANLFRRIYCSWG